VAQGEGGLRGAWLKSTIGGASRPARYAWKAIVFNGLELAKQMHTEVRQIL
jgi:hypothetical protein